MKTPIPREVQWACQAEFKADLLRVRAHEVEMNGGCAKETLLMAEFHDRAAAGIWDSLEDAGFTRPGSYAPHNYLPTSAPE